MNKIKKKYKILILCIVLLFVVLSIYFIVNNKSNSYIPVNEVNIENFNFRLNFNTYGKDQIDTYKETYTKDIVMDGTKTINFKIPDRVKKEVYKLMVEVNILSIPDNLKIDGIAVEPPSDYNLKVTINGKTKNIVWHEGFDTSMTENIPEDNMNFLKIVKYISDYIYNTEEYKSMPDVNGGYN